MAREEAMKETCGLGEGTHHFACDCRERQVKALVEAGKFGVRILGENTKERCKQQHCEGCQEDAVQVVHQLEEALAPFIQKVESGEKGGA